MILHGEEMRLPSASHIDRHLALGGVAFGAGWGIAGSCQGPALASLASGGAKPLIFIADDRGDGDLLAVRAARAAA